MSGDVQGNTTNVIPNQTGQSINKDGEDEKILYAQAEKTTNELENIKLISRAEYMDLFGYSFAGGSALPSYAGQTIHFLSHSSYITFQMPVQ